MEFLADIFEYRYLTNAVIACILSGVMCGIIGTYIVARRMVFLCGGITHASFGGIGIALYMGLNPLYGALTFAGLSAVSIEWLSMKGRIREDSAIGVIWGVGMAIGALFMNLRPGYTTGETSNFLFGNIITVTDTDIKALIAVIALVIMGAFLWHRQVMYTAFDRDFARSLGVHTQFITYAMSIVTAVALVLSIRIMGIILLISLFTMPVVIANIFTKSYRHIAFLAVIFAVTASLAGVATSYYMELPSGPTIIFILALAFLILKILSLCLKGIRCATSRR